MTKKPLEVAINNITTEILSTASLLDSEMRYPSSNPDAMDGKISFYRRKLDSLRNIRAQLEDLQASGPDLGY
jgi:hypothetical protein